MQRENYKVKYSIILGIANIIIYYKSNRKFDNIQEVIGVPDYQALYAALFRKVTAAIEELQSVQRQTEERHLSSVSPEIKIMPDDKAEDEKTAE